MATLNNAVQSLVDNLHSKMTSNTPLSAEEQTLIAAAIDKLSSHTNWESALIAVAEEHLNSATDHMSQTLATATSALTSAQGDINAAKSSIESQSANLALLPSMESNLFNAISVNNQQSQQNIDQSFAGVPKPVFGLKLVETSGLSQTNARSQAIFAIYQENGETYATRPAFTVTNTSEHYNLLQYIKLAADGSSQTVLKSHYVDSATFYQNPTSYIYRYTKTALLPLATTTNSQDIQYEVVYSTQDAASTAVANYHGVYCASCGFDSATKPKLNTNATDQWGISTLTDHNWAQMGVLYDNVKHCLVMVDEATSLLVEKYRDGDIVTQISIANSDALQAYVNSGDFTVVRFICVHINYPQINVRYSGALSSTSISHYLDVYGFYGKQAGEIRIAGTQYSAHYRFTSAQKLEPLNFNVTSSASHYQASSSTGAVSGRGNAYVGISDFNGNSLGLFHYQSDADKAGSYPGYLGGAIMCMNPYSKVGLLNDGILQYGGNTYYGNGRIAKAF